MRKLQLLLMGWAVIAAVPAAAQTQLQLQQQAKQGEGGAAEPMPLHATASLTHSVGSGTFVTGSGNNPTLSSALTLTPLASYRGFTFLLNQSFGFEYTQSDYTSAPNQVEMSDLVVAGRYNRFSVADVLILPTVSYVAPLSLSSRNVGSVGTLGGGVRGIYNFNDYGLTVYATASTAFTGLVPALSQRFASNDTKPVVDDSGNSLATVGCNVRNIQELSSYACLDGNLPSVWRWSTGTGIAWSGLDGKLNVNVDLGFSQGFSAYYGADDEFTAANARTGWTPRQSTSGNISVTYVPVGWFFLTGGLGSQQALFTNNCFASDDNATDECVAGDVSNEHVRFPFWDFETPRDNNSSLFVDTTFSF
jgi:hypothetical protein